MLFTRNLFHAALLLLTCLLSLACIFVLVFAEFVAVTQVLIYAGGVVILILFGIMLTTKITGKPLVVGNANQFAGAVAGVSLGVVLLYCFYHLGDHNTSPETGEPMLRNFGIAIMTDYVLPFELAGLLLLLALVGAAITATAKKSNDDSR